MCIYLHHFNHPFIIHIVIQFIWYFRYESFLGNEPLEKLNYIIVIVGAATHCMLLEQRMPVPSVDPFTGLVHYNKFINIVDTLKGLEGEDKIALEASKRYILEVGPSQMRSAVDIADYLDDLDNR